MRQVFKVVKTVKAAKAVKAAEGVELVQRHEGTGDTTTTLNNLIPQIGFAHVAVMFLPRRTTARTV